MAHLFYRSATEGVLFDQVRLNRGWYEEFAPHILQRPEVKAFLAMTPEEREWPTAANGKPVAPNPEYVCQHATPAEHARSLRAKAYRLKHEGDIESATFWLVRAANIERPRVVATAGGVA